MKLHIIIESAQIDNRQAEQSPEIGPHIEDHLIYHKGANEIHGGRRDFLIYGTGSKDICILKLDRYYQIIHQKANTNLYSPTCLKSTSWPNHINIQGCLQRMDILFIEHKVLFLYNAIHSLFK